MTDYKTIVAQDLLAIEAVSLQPRTPFTWASGLKSPIYTDNRVTIGYPQVRTHIADGLTALVNEFFPQAEMIAGTATAGIPHAAWIADRLNLPMTYVRSKPKDHGQGRQIEGRLLPGAKTVVVDDLISTGGSVLKAVAAARAAGADVVGVVGIFSYELDAATTNFAEADVPFQTLTNYSALVDIAAKSGYVAASDLELLHKWRENPATWGDQFTD